MHEPHTPPEPYSSFHEAATRLGITTQTLHAWHKKAYVQAIELPNGYRRISESEILRLLKGRQVNR